MEKYGDKIILCEVPSRGCIISDKNIGQQILSYSRYLKDRITDVLQERLRIVRAAGEIILEDIRSKVFDTSTYPPNNNFLGGVHPVVSETLILLLHTLILAGKKGSLNMWKKKCLVWPMQS